MKRYMAGIIAVTLLSACSSAGKLRDTVPTAVYVGSSSASDVISCVSNAWATKHFQIDTVPLPSGTSLQLRENDSGPVLALVDVTPTAGGTTTAKYYSQMPDDDTWFFQQVKSCM
ncbi:hypothetical protein HDE79_003488 [Rhodanobacter sp. MP1X3]|nr:hypothetical protein [Rhodanobacter sp. MP1X3]